MLFYDLDINAWVRTPGSKSPPQMTPVLTIGGVFEIAVTFVQDGAIYDPLASSYYLGAKLAGDMAGAYIAHDSAPTTGGDAQQVFSLDLTTVAAKAYFTTNPTEDTVAAVLQLKYVADSIERRTVPMAIVLQNDYLQDQ